jgi:hypothetical protein
MATLGHLSSKKSFESVALDFLLLPSDKSSPKEKVSESILAFLQNQKPKTKTKNTGFTCDIYIYIYIPVRNLIRKLFCRLPASSSATVFQHWKRVLWTWVLRIASMLSVF